VSYIEPLLAFLLTLTLLFALRCRRRHKDGTTGLLLCSVAALFLLSMPPVAWLTSRPFESWYSRQPFPGGDAQAIVVLSSNILPPRPERPIPLPDRDTYERCQYAAWLYHNWHKLPIVAGGGASQNGGESYATTMSRILQAEGVEKSMIWTEQSSHSTHENAVYAADLLRAKGIHKVALVTEAYHMLRSEKCFRKQGLEVLPAPCGFRTLDLGLDDFLPGWKPIFQNERTLHEAIGLLWYRMRGWI
jgi:uncharacterized SAM-binding protein YcdF (DUF218 family)